MDNKQRFYNLLGLAMKAGKLVTGEEITLKQVRQGTLSLVVIASDLSDNTKKKLRDKCQTYNVPLLEVGTTAEISLAIGRKRSIIGVADQGFSRKMSGLMKE